MSDHDLRRLAASAGVAAEWRDAFGNDRQVAPQTLRLVLKSLEIPAESDAETRDSLARLANTAPVLPPLLTADQNQPVFLPVSPRRYRLTLEDGAVFEGVTSESQGGSLLPAIAHAGYHDLRVGDVGTTVAVAPPRCLGIRDIAPKGRLWGLAVQLYGLRRQGDLGIGDFAGLADFARHAAGSGADAVAISPIHAQFSADLDRFSPYSPSSRIQLNVLHAAIDEIFPAMADAGDARYEALALVDWQGAGGAKLARFRKAWELFRASPAHDLTDQFNKFRAESGDALELHARFETLHAHFFGRHAHLWNWRNWPEAYRDPHSIAVNEFARVHQAEVGFHAFLQFLADRGLADAQRAAREAGMHIGLISDLAVGTDGGGSHAWSRQGETLIGLSIGAPPDLLSTTGQDWGLTGFSPAGLIRHGYAAYLEMLRGALKHAGGVRIDHVMGLARLWVMPEGASAAEGAYLHYPLHDLMRLIALESQRHRAVILGEDLGTVPDGFQHQIEQRGLFGLRVLWFEGDHGRFRAPSHWTRDAAAMTSTHDLATVSGWWQGHDLDLRRDLGILGDEQNVWLAYESRERERGALWDAFRESGATSSGRPPSDQPLPAVDAALSHVGSAACDLALLPLEDALASAEQPNLPGTIDQHPNWRRRMALGNEAFFAEPGVAARLRRFSTARRPPEG